MSKLEDYKDMLSKNKFKPMTKAETNKLALECTFDNEELKDKIFCSNARLAVKAMETVTKNMLTKSADEVMELIMVANEAILDALELYKHDKIDFSYFAYIHAINYIKYYLKTDYTIKPRVVKGEYRFPLFDSIDKERDAESDEPQELLELYYEEPSADITQDLIEAVKSLKIPAYKKEVFLYTYNFGGMKMRIHKEVSKKLGYSPQRVSQILQEVITKIKESEKAMELFKEIYE